MPGPELLKSYSSYETLGIGSTRGGLRPEFEAFAGL